MQVDIWFDIRCPFCYIGKRKFEAALNNFKQKDEVQVIWHSFELDPKLKVENGTNYVEHFSEMKNVSKVDALKMFDYVANMGKEAGIEINLEKAVVANSFNAHRLVQFAKANDRANEMVERLFCAHFINGEDINDSETLCKIGKDIGFSAEEVNEVVNSTQFSNFVINDEYEAQLGNISGVPYFIFDNRYAVSGAQPVETFLEIIEKSYAESIENVTN